VIGCYATGCSTVAAFVDGIYLWCVASGNTFGGFASTSNLGVFVRCIAANNSGASSDGFSFTAAGQAINCTCYGNGRHGVNVATNNNPIVLMNTPLGRQRRQRHRLRLLGHRDAARQRDALQLRQLQQRQRPRRRDDPAGREPGRLRHADRRPVRQRGRRQLRA
jgi:hypothetical protein